MQFKLWLISKKGLSLKTATLYQYYVDKTIDFKKEYENKETSSSKRLLYFAHKHYFEFKGYKFPKLEVPKKNADKVMRYISYLEYRNIIENYVSNNTMWSINGKEIAMFAFIYGLRINEILSLKYEDIVDGNISIIGKGNKHRTIPVADSLAIAAFNNSGYIIRNRGKQISYSSARTILEDVISKLNIKRCSWHSFRHGFAVRMLINKIDIYNISKMMGHSSLETTAKYLKYDNKLLKIELKKLGLFS